MRNLFIIIIISVYSISFNCQSLELSISGNNSTFVVGQEIELNISFKDLDGKFVQQSGNEPILDLKDFEKKIIVICNNTGKQTFGPYKININNRLIESNTVTVSITNSSISFEKSDTTISILFPELVNKGDEFTINLKSNVPLNSKSKKPNTVNIDNLSQYSSKSIRILKNSKIKQIGFSESKSISVKDGISKAQYIYTFTVLAENKGTFVVSPEIFEPHLPKMLDNKIIEIK